MPSHTFPNTMKEYAENAADQARRIDMVQLTGRIDDGCLASASADTVSARLRGLPTKHLRHEPAHDVVSGE